MISLFFTELNSSWLKKLIEKSIASIYEHESLLCKGRTNWRTEEQPNASSTTSAIVMSKRIDFQAVDEAYRRIQGSVHRTPAFTSSSINALVGKRVYFKAECLQKTGSFKARGAMNAIRQLQAENVTHVITHSSGNHGQALAFAARECGMTCTVVVPENSPEVKVNAIKAYGATIVFCESTMHARKNTCDWIMQDTGAVFVHPHDDVDVVAGQGTMAVELLEDVPDLDAILVPVGGGGMIAGIAAWAKHAKPNCKIFAVEPHGKQLARSLDEGKLICDDPSTLLNTIADGMRVPGIGEQCFPVLAQLVEKEVLSVTDKEIICAMKLIYQRLKLVVEPSGATATAALLGEAFRNQRSIHSVGVIICGGNVDLDHLPWANR